MSWINSFFCFLGLPLGVLVVLFLKLFGLEGDSEGFQDLAKWIGILYYSGITTVIVAVVLIFMWLF